MNQNTPIFGICNPTLLRELDYDHFFEECVHIDEFVYKSVRIFIVQANLLEKSRFRDLWACSFPALLAETSWSEQKPWQKNFLEYAKNIGQISLLRKDASQPKTTIYFNL